MTADDLLLALDDAQREAAVAVRGPVCILAGAGTGKTRTITHRIAYGVLTGAVNPDHVLAVTFTARAAGELRGRLRELGAPSVAALTFHAAALKQVQHFWPQVVGGDAPQVLASKVPVIIEAARRSGVRAEGTVVRDLASEIEWAKARLADPTSYVAVATEAKRQPPVSVEKVAAIYAAYEKAKGERHVVDFEDLLLVAAGFVEDAPRVATAVRDRYRHFTVDEYQDVSPLQQRLLDAWVGGRHDLCVVGDPNQTIYTFAGARASYLLEFVGTHVGARTVELTRNYRSTAAVLTLANRLNRGGVRLEATVSAGPEPVIRGYDDAPAEAAGIAARCAGLIAAGTPAREIAVLFRTNGQSAEFERALTTAGVPYVVRGAERFFDRKEVRRALVTLRGAVVGGDTGDDLVAHVGHVLSSVGWRPEPPSGQGATREAWESLSAIVRLAEEHDGDFASFVAELQERASAQHAPPPVGVTLASLHAAKGLEWDAVFVCGLVDGYLPISFATTDEQLAEERRLLYVGVTRARRELSLSWYGNRRRSRFLEDVAPSAAPAPRQGAARSSTKKGAVCRICGATLSSAPARKLGRCEGCPSNVDEATLDRLKAWRLELSRLAKVPAFVIFTDVTLLAIAEQQPKNSNQLACVKGVGAKKLELYGEDVLALLKG
ncbi:MAG: ATP-dependent helicase UvrD/PcrA [Frankiaceae bacterium]|nr:ATP-dependent helicase UvrD/PcrA [Frankiaceae bacterium]